MKITKRYCNIKWSVLSLEALMDATGADVEWEWSKTTSKPTKIYWTGGHRFTKLSDVIDNLIDFCETIPSAVNKTILVNAKNSSGVHMFKIEE